MSNTKILRVTLALSLALATIGAHAGSLLLSLTEAGEMGRPDLAALKAEMPRRVQQRDMTVATQVAVVRRNSAGAPMVIGGFDCTCSFIDAERFRDGTAERSANAANAVTRDLMNSAAALIRVADQQRLAAGYVGMCVVSDRTKDYEGLLKLPPQGFVVQAVSGMVYLVQLGGVLMFTL